MAQAIKPQLKEIINNNWHIAFVDPDQVQAIASWCRATMGGQLGVLEYQQLEEDKRWYMEVPVRASLVTSPAFVAFRHEQDMIMYRLKWGDS